jgi:hypothetical protein
MLAQHVAVIRGVDDPSPFFLPIFANCIEDHPDLLVEKADECVDD